MSGRPDQRMRPAGPAGDGARSPRHPLHVPAGDWRRGRVPALALAAALGCSAGIASSGLNGIQPGTAATTGDRRCGVALLPASLPPVNAILDSAAVTTALLSESSEPDPTVLSVGFLRTGHPRPVRVLSPRLPTPASRNVQQVIAARLRAQRPAPAWGVRILIQAGPVPRMSLQRSSYCEPARRPGPRVVTSQRMSLSDVPNPSSLPAELAAARACRVRLALDTTGTVIDARIVRSSGSRFVDDLALDVAHSANLLPALLDDHPIDGWTEFESCRAPIRSR